MRLSPYEAFDGVRFGDSVEQVLLTVGEPARQSHNRRGELELWYADLVVRLTDAGVQELSACPSEVLIGDDVVPIGDLAAYVRGNDPTATEHVGFLTGRRLGVMVDLDHDEVWMTAFTRGRMDA